MLQISKMEKSNQTFKAHWHLVDWLVFPGTAKSRYLMAVPLGVK